MKKLLLIIGLCSFINVAMADTVLPAGSAINAKFDSRVSLFKNITPSEPESLSVNIIDKKLTGCTAITSAYPDLGSNRIMMQVNKLNCNGFVINIEAYVVGDDGKSGIPAIRTSKQTLTIEPNTEVQIVTMNSISISESR